MKIRRFPCNYTALVSPLLLLCCLFRSDIQHFSFFCFFLPPSLFSSLLLAGLWIFLQIGNTRVKKKKKHFFPFLAVWCVFRHCASLLTSLTSPPHPTPPLQRWLQGVTPVITAKNRANHSLSSHASFPHLFFLHISFQLNARESEFNKA